MDMMKNTAYENDMRKHIYEKGLMEPIAYEKGLRKQTKKPKRG